MLNDEHLLIRIEQCMALAMASPCRRSQYAALLLDPEHNQVLLDSFNRPASCGPHADLLCGGVWCEREGLCAGDIEVIHFSDGADSGFYIAHVDASLPDGGLYLPAVFAGPFDTRAQALGSMGRVRREHPPVEHGHRQIGCLCAERRVLLQAARRGVSCEGRMIVVVGAPCLACAKAMCEAGISSVAAVTDEHADETGIVFLRRQTGIELRLLSVDEVFELGKSIRKLRKEASGRMI